MMRLFKVKKRLKEMNRAPLNLSSLDYASAAKLYNCMHR